MNTEIKSWAEWAVSQGWTVEDNEKGYTHFWTPGGTWAGYYPATPSNPHRRLQDLKVALRKHGATDPAAEQEGTTSDAPQAGRAVIPMAWVVTLTYDIDVDAETIVSWGDQLDALDASVAPEPGGGVSITVWVDEAEDVFDAQHTAHKVAHNVIPDNPIGVEALTHQAYVATADTPTLPEMVSAPEVGEILGVTRQRVSQLQHTAGFPDPLYRLRTGPIWDAKAIRAFARVWDRRPGPKSRAS